MPDPATPDARRERSATVVCAAIGALALVLSLVFVLTTGDNSRGVVLGGGPTTYPTGGSDGGGGSGGGGSGASATTGRTAAYYLAHFPLPPGAHVSTTKPGSPGPHEVIYDAPGSSISLRPFYDAALPKIGLEWGPPLTTTAGGKVVGWHGSLYAKGPPKIDGQLSLDDSYVTPGVVWIDIQLDQS